MAVRTVFLNPYHNSSCVDAFECQVEEVRNYSSAEQDRPYTYRLLECPSYCPHCKAEIHSIPSQEEMREAFYSPEAEDV